MRKLVVLVLLALAPLELYGEEAGRTGAWTEVVESPEGRYSLAFDPADSRVDVTKLNPGGTSPSAMKLRILRNGDRPFDIKLKTLDVPNEPVHYEGTLKNWNGSVIGFELEAGFDKKTWKKFKRMFGGAGH